MPARKALFVQMWERFGNPLGRISRQVECKLDFCPDLALWPGALMQCTTLQVVALSVIAKVILVAHAVAVTSL